MKKAAAYIRVSTSEQTEYSPESQVRLIKDYADKNDIIISEEFIYRDEGISGRSAEKRPQFQKMIAAAKLSPPPFDCILVYSTSRFARNHEESIIYRSFLERECGISVISITQPNIDKKTDMLTTAIYSIMDEWYSLDLSDNVKRGMTQKAMEGGHQAAPPYGYEINYKGALMTVNTEEASVIKYIFNTFLQGKSKWAIAKELNEKNITTKKNNPFDSRKITYILRNPVYSGYSRWTPSQKAYWDFKNKDTIITKAFHEPIISETTFEQVQKILDDLDKKKPDRPMETTSHWLSGVIKCSACGSSLNYQKENKNRKASFKCGNYCKGICSISNYLTAEKAEQIVLNAFKELFKDLNTQTYVLKEPKIPLKDTLKEQTEKKYKNYLERSKKAYLAGLFTLDEYKEIYRKTSKELANLRRELSQETQPLTINNIYNFITSESSSKIQKQQAVKSIVEKIIFNKSLGKFIIYFNTNIS